MRLANRVSGISESVTLEITSKAKKMAKEGIDVVSFAAGEPDFDTPKHIKDAAIKAINEGFTKYTPSSGMPELREAIANKFKTDNGIDYAPNQIVVSNGAKHSLNNVFQAICNAGDEVLILAPYWLSYPAMVGMAEAKPVFVETRASNGFKVTEKDLEPKITNKTKCLVLNSPSNPTGGIYDMDDLKMIARLAVKHNFFVISDEIYEKLIYDGRKHHSIASLGKEIYDLTITVNGVSKSYSMTGWRIGYLAGDKEVVKGISSLQSHSTSNPASISQAAAVAALNGGTNSIKSMAAEFEKRRNVMLKGLDKIKKIKYNRPEGAFYCFADISRTGMSSVDFAKKLLSQVHIAAIPGEPFGMDDHVRFSFATNVDEIKKGIKRLKEWLS